MAVEMSAERKVTPTTLKEHVNEKHEVDEDKILIRHVLAESEKTAVNDKTQFGLVASFLAALAKSNEGTTTSIISMDGVFQRAFLCPGTCVNAFWNTTKIVGLDACHVKAY